MDDLIWDNSLSVQVQEIDDDHQKLVDLFNLLSHSLNAGEDKDYLDAILKELISCTAWHFKHEERLMVKYRYEGLDSHRAEHNELISSAENLYKDFLENDRVITGDDIDFLERWLTGHILGVDMDLGRFLGEVM